jgi:hypothetical protein
VVSVDDIHNEIGVFCAKVIAIKWRRGWDSNPRLSFPNTRFPSVLLKPLGHLSAACCVQERSKLAAERQTQPKDADWRSPLGGNIAKKITGGPNGLSRRQMVLLARAEYKRRLNPLALVRA